MCTIIEATLEVYTLGFHLVIEFSYFTIRKYCFYNRDKTYKCLNFEKNKIRSENSLKCAVVKKTTGKVGGCCESPGHSQGEPEGRQEQ